MKTAPMMITFLPRFRWFVWGFGLCAVVWNMVDGYLFPFAFIGVGIMLVLGFFTYIPESINRSIVENDRRIAKAEERAH